MAVDDIFDGEPWASELQAALAFLVRHNKRGVDPKTLTAMAKRIVWETAWAKNWRNNKRVRPDRTRRRTSNVSILPKARSIVEDLKRMRAAIARGQMAFTLAWVEASPAAQDRISAGHPLTLGVLMNRHEMLTRIDKALAAPGLNGRPRDIERDRLAAILVRAFEALIEPATATRDPITEAFSPAHSFLVEASNVLGLQLCGPCDDKRLRRVLRERAAAKTGTFAG